MGYGLKVIMIFNRIVERKFKIKNLKRRKFIITDEIKLAVLIIILLNWPH